MMPSTECTQDKGRNALAVLRISVSLNTCIRRFSCTYVVLHQVDVSFRHIGVSQRIASLYWIVWSFAQSVELAQPTSAHHLHQPISRSRTPDNSSTASLVLVFSFAAAEVSFVEQFAKHLLQS